MSKVEKYSNIEKYPHKFSVDAEGQAYVDEKQFTTYKVKEVVAKKLLRIWIASHEGYSKSHWL